MKALSFNCRRSGSTESTTSTKTPKSTTPTEIPQPTAPPETPEAFQYEAIMNTSIRRLLNYWLRREIRSGRDQQIAVRVRMIICEKA